MTPDNGSPWQLMHTLFMLLQTPSHCPSPTLDRAQADWFLLWSSPSGHTNHSQTDHWVLESVETFATGAGDPGQNYTCVLNYKGDNQYSGNEWNSNVVKSLHGQVPRPTTDTSVWVQPCYGRFFPCAVTKNCIKRLLTAHCRGRISA